MRKHIAVAAVVVACLAWTMAVANAQRPGGAVGAGAGQGGGARLGGRPGGAGGPGMFGRGGPGVMLGGLDLTADQQTQVKQLMESERDASRQSRQALGEARQALHAAIFGSPVDSAAVAALQARVVAAEQAQLNREVQLQLTLAGILTPEQRAKVLARKGPGGLGDGGSRGPRGFGGGGRR